MADLTKRYRSKETFEVRSTTSMGITFVDVVNDLGMVTARLTENDFEQQFEPIPDPPSTP